MGFKLGRNKVRKITYKYFPKDRDELRVILKKRLAEDKNANLNDIDVSEITDMNDLFLGLDPHNIDISEWNVLNVENMYGMFSACVNFNSDLSNWNTSNLIDMKYMFYFCRKFEGNGLEKWNVSKVKYMKDALEYCESLKKLPSWYKN